MLEALLRHCGAFPPREQVPWVKALPGIEACAFDCPLPEEPVAAVPGGGRLELLFCRSGGLHLTLGDGRRITINAREILLLPGSTAACSISSAGERLEGVLVSIELALASVGGAIEGFDSWAVLPQPAWGKVAVYPLETLPADGLAHYCALVAAELLCLAFYGGGGLPGCGAEVYFDHYQVAAVRQVHGYMLAHLGERLTIDGLSRRFHLSSTLLKECFRQLYDKPIHQYLQACRMQRAGELLTSTTLPVLQVALSVGYSSASQFTVIFRRHYGETPSQHRRAALKMSKTVYIRPNPTEFSGEI